MEISTSPTPGNNAPVSVGNWLLTIIVASIPLVGLIMLLVWSFSDDTPVSKRNYCKALLILMVVAIILFGIIIAVGGGLAALTGGLPQPQLQP